MEEIRRMSGVKQTVLKIMSVSGTPPLKDGAYMRTSPLFVEAALTAFRSIKCKYFIARSTYESV